MTVKRQTDIDAAVVPIIAKVKVEQGKRARPVKYPRTNEKGGRVRPWPGIPLPLSMDFSMTVDNYAWDTGAGIERGYILKVVTEEKDGFYVKEYLLEGTRPVQSTFVKWAKP